MRKAVYQRAWRVDGALAGPEALWVPRVPVRAPGVKVVKGLVKGHVGDHGKVVGGAPGVLILGLIGPADGLVRGRRHAL